MCCLGLRLFVFLERLGFASGPSAADVSMVLCFVGFVAGPLLLSATVADEWNGQALLEEEIKGKQNQQVLGRSFNSCHDCGFMLNSQQSYSVRNLNMILASV